MTKAESNTPLFKKILFYAIIGLASVTIIELCSYVIMKIEFEDYSPSSLTSIRNNIIINNDKELINKPDIEVLHPYLGYVYNLETNHPDMAAYHGGLPVSEFGFIDSHSPFYKQKDDTIIIGIFGGSVAYFFSAFGIDSLIDQLKYSSFFKNKKFKVARVALGGYKQPQQLLSLTYLLSLGAYFDIVINLDGFNEIALPPVDNIPYKVNPFFPRNWHWQAKKLMNNETKALMGAIGYHRQKRKKFASTFNKRIIRHSNIMNFIWRLSDQFFVNKIGQKQIALNLSMKNDTNNYERSGPEYVYNNTLELYRDLANYWKQSSQQMAKICESNNILYWHFLQPNQYVINSKTLSEDEKKLAYRYESPYRIPVERGYSILQNKGRELSASNIQFHDLTMIFNNYLDTLYLDNCCHLTEKGNKILGKHIGEIIIKDLEK